MDFFDELWFSIKEFANFSSLRQVYKEEWFFTIYELREMESQCEQDEILKCALKTCANDNTCVDLMQCQKLRAS